MARFTAPALDRLASAAARRGVGLLAGTMPVAVAGAYVNRAHLLLPDGTRHAQDKLCLTPFERDPSGWTVEPGTRLTVIEWRGLRVAILICLDLEQPALAGRLQDLDLDLVLVPSMTDLPSGYRRVFNCARARAIELMCPVAVVGTLGTQVVNGRTDRNASGAGVFLPCEPGLGMTGVHSELPMATETDDDGPLLVARQVPVAACRILRRGGAEAWAGPWTADHVEFLHRSTPLSRLRQARR
jgi:predicted amidohydrolase